MRSFLSRNSFQKIFTSQILFRNLVIECNETEISPVKGILSKWIRWFSSNSYFCMHRVKGKKIE